MSVRLRAMTAADWPAVATIYQAGIDDGNATFEDAPPSWDAFDAGRIEACRLVAVDGATVLGWAAVSPISARPAYAGVVEHSVYVAAAARGRGVGRALLDRLIQDSEAASIWTIQASIFPENAASLTLHQRAGFRVIGRRERIALMTYGPLTGTWRDTLLIERRSA